MGRVVGGARERLPWLRVRQSAWAGLRLMFHTNQRPATRLSAVSVVQGPLPPVFTVVGDRLVSAAPRAPSRRVALSSPAGRRLLVALEVVAVVFLLGEVIRR